MFPDSRFDSLNIINVIHVSFVSVTIKDATFNVWNEDASKKKLIKASTIEELLQKGMFQKLMDIFLYHLCKQLIIVFHQLKPLQRKLQEL